MKNTFFVQNRTFREFENGQCSNLKGIWKNIEEFPNSKKTHFIVFFQVFSRKHLRYPSNSHFLRF